MKNVHYSVPDSLVGEKVHVKVYSEKIVILYGKEKVASHQRSYCGGDWYIKLEHYLRTLSRKPGHCPTLWFGKRAPEELRRLYDIHFKGGQQDVCSVAGLCRKMDFRNGHCHGMQGADRTWCQKRYLGPGKGHAAW